jgi:hypothetical protein
MDAQELLTAPASTLTRKQRKERAALKRQLATKIGVPAGYEVGAVRCRSMPVPVGVEQIVVDHPESIKQAIDLGKLDPRAGNVRVRLGPF